MKLFNMKRKIIAGLIILPLLAGGSFTRASLDINTDQSQINSWYSGITNNVVTNSIESMFASTFARCARANKAFIYLFVRQPETKINLRTSRLKVRYASLISQSAPVIDLSKEEKKLKELYKDAQKTLSRKQIKALQTVIADIEAMGLDLSDWAEAFMDRSNKKGFRTFLDELKSKLEMFRNDIVARAYQMQQREKDRNLKKAFGIIYDILGEMHSKLEIVHDAFLQAERNCDRNATKFANRIKPVLDNLTSDATFEFFDGKLRKLQDTLKASHEALAKHIQILRSMAKKHHQTIMKKNLSSRMEILGTLRNRLRC